MHRIRTLLLALVVMAPSLAVSGTARAAELLMFEAPWCTYCQKWASDIGTAYPRTVEGRIAPLKTIDVSSPLPGGLHLKSRPVYTPTFVLIEDGREIGRIEGYSSENSFWGQLDRLILRLSKPDAPDAPDETAPSVTSDT